LTTDQRGFTRPNPGGTFCDIGAYEVNLAADRDLSIIKTVNSSVALPGDTITYEYDDVANAAALALFGAPTVVGDELRFLPPSFRAESIDGAGSDVVSANFIFSRIYSHGGGDIMSISVVEFGDYEIINGDSVGADVLLTVSNNNDFTEFANASDAFDAAGDSGGLMTWLMQAGLNPAVLFDSVANDVALSLQNTLVATTDAFGETAWIQKKITVVASAVPVPAAVWLFGSALGLLGWARRRRV